jgi:hypothetical protein
MSNYGQGLGGCGSSGGGSSGGGSGVATSAVADSPDNNFSLPYPCLLPTFFPLIPWPLPTSSFQSPWLVPFVTSSGIHIFFNTKMGVAECVAKVVRVVCLELIAFFKRANSTDLEDFARKLRHPDVIDEQVFLKCVRYKFRPEHMDRLAFARSLCNNASPDKEALNDLVACVLMFLAARNAGAHCDQALAQHEPGSPKDACETELRFVSLCNQVLNDQHLDYAVARKLAYKINSFELEAEVARADGTTHVGLLPLHLCNIGAAIFNTLGANNSHDIMLALHCGLAELAW